MLAVLYCIINILTLVACIVAFVSLRKINLIGAKRKGNGGKYDSMMDEQNATTGFVSLTTIGLVRFISIAFLSATYAFCPLNLASA